MLKNIYNKYLNNEINEVIIVLNNKDRIDKYKNFIKKEDYNFKITFAEDEIKNISERLREQLSDHGVEADVSGREKHPYSIWRKMAERHVSFEQVTDIFAFRVILQREMADVLVIYQSMI